MDMHDGPATSSEPGVSIWRRYFQMKRIAFLAILALASIASAQFSSPPAAVQLNTIYAGADGKFEAAPDTAVIRMDIASQQDTSRAAYDRAAQAVDRVRQVLTSNG